MNAYQLIIAIVALSQSFLCISSESYDDDFNIKDRRILKALRIHQSHPSLSDPIIFPMCIEESLQSFFEPPIKKLKCPNDKLRQWARKELEEKHLLASSFKNNLVAAQPAIDELSNRTKASDEYKELEDKLAENEKRLAIARKELEKQSALAQHLAQQMFPDNKPNNKTAPRKSVAKKAQKKNPLTPAQEKNNALKSLYTQFNVHPRTKKALYPQLAKRCDEIYNSKTCNNSVSGPYLNLRTHSLSGAINATWSFVYCPCNGIFHLLNYTFCNLSQSKEFINAYCPSKKCKQYEMDSYSPSDEDNDAEILLSKTALLEAPHVTDWPVLDYRAEETDGAHEDGNSASAE